MPNFSGGLGHLGMDVRHMKPEEAYLALNSDLFRELGALHAIKDKRLIETYTLDGVAVPIHAAHKFRGVFLVHAGENLYYGNASTPVRAFVSTNPMVVVNYEDSVYFTNGVEFLKMTVSDIGALTFETPFVVAPVSTGITVAEADDGQLSQGKYQYLYTYIDAFNAALPHLSRDESPPDSLPKIATVSISLSGDNKKVVHSNLPTSTGFNLVIWRWKVGEGFEFRLVTEITDSSTSYTDDVHTNQLGGILTSQDYETPPIPLDLERFNNTLVLLDIRSWQDRPMTEIDNYIFWSADRRFSCYDPHFLDISGETDDRVMGGKVLNNSFYVFTKARVEGLFGASAQQYRESTQQARTGLAARLALVNTITYGLLFLGSDRALHIFDGFRFNEKTDLRKMDNLFAEDSTHPHRMNWDARDKCRLSFLNQKARLAYPSVSSTTNDKILKMDFRDFPRIIFTIDDYEATGLFADEVNNQMIAGNSSGELFEVEAGNTFLPARWKSKDFDLGDIEADKIYKKLRIDMNSQGKDINTTLTIDDEAKGTPTLNKSNRKSKFSTFRSFLTPNLGARAAVEIYWNHPNDDVVLYDYEVDAQIARKP